MIDLTIDAIKKAVKIKNNKFSCVCFLCNNVFNYHINLEKLDIAIVKMDNKQIIVCLDCIRNENDYFKLYHKIKGKLKC